MSEVIRLDQVSVRYAGADTDALHEIDLVVEQGQVVLVTGRSGGGKSTLAGLVNGIVPHLHEATVDGRVEVVGRCPGEVELHELGRVVSTVFQNPRTQFFCADSTAEMAFASENAGRPPTEIRQRVGEVVDELGMHGLVDREMARLSGGQKQQVAIAAATVTAPSLYVLDEPTSNLDDRGVQAVRELLGRLRRAGASVLITEHRLAFLRGLVDRVVVLDGGRVVLDLSGDEFYSLSDEKRRGLGLRRVAEHRMPPVRTEGEGGLQVNGLRHPRRGTPILDLDDLHLPRGKVSVLVGHNGAGKSTLVRVLSGLVAPRGSIRVDGQELDARSRLARSHVVMQDVNRQLFADSVAAELRLSRADVDVEAVLEPLGLAAYADRHPMSLSGGQRQRVAVAGADAADRDLVFFDEPTSGLDHDGMLATAAVLRRLAEQDRVVVVVTHDTELAEACGDVVVRLPERPEA